MLSGEPSQVQQFILSLDLGSSGHHISTGIEGIIDPINSTYPRSTRSVCDNARVCHHVTTPHGKCIVVKT